MGVALGFGKLSVAGKPQRVAPDNAAAGSDGRIGYERMQGKKCPHSVTQPHGIRDIGIHVEEAWADAVIGQVSENTEVVGTEECAGGVAHQSALGRAHDLR